MLRDEGTQLRDENLALESAFITLSQARVQLCHDGRTRTVDRAAPVLRDGGPCGGWGPRKKNTAAKISNFHFQDFSHFVQFLPKIH